MAEKGRCPLGGEEGRGLPPGKPVFTHLVGSDTVRVGLRSEHLLHRPRAQGTITAGPQEGVRLPHAPRVSHSLL